MKERKMVGRKKIGRKDNNSGSEKKKKKEERKINEGWEENNYRYGKGKKKCATSLTFSLTK